MTKRIQYIIVAIVVSYVSSECTLIFEDLATHLASKHSPGLPSPLPTLPRTIDDVFIFTHRAIFGKCVRVISGNNIIGDTFFFGRLIFLLDVVSSN